MIDRRIKHTDAGTGRRTNGYTRNLLHGCLTARTAIYSATGSNDGTPVWPAIHRNGQTAEQPHGETVKRTNEQTAGRLGVFPRGQTVKQVDNRMIARVSTRTGVQSSKTIKMMIIQILN
jgi:hypothetical protein